MSKQGYPSYEAYYNDVAKAAIEDCTLCGECARNCPIFPYTPISDKSPEDVMESVIDFLRNGAYSEEVYIKAFTCNECGNCSELCPQGIDVMLLHEVVKIGLEKQNKLPESVNFVLPGRRPNLYETLSALQLKPSDKRWLNKIPQNPRKAENVVFLGCFLPALPHVSFAFLDVLEGMGVDFITLAGDELCCGTSLCPAAGKVEESEKKARELVEGITRLSPERVLLLCTGCYRQFTEFFPKYLDVDFDVQYYTRFLLDNLEKMDFTNSLDETVVLHESCMTKRTGVYESAKRLLNTIPGLNLTEMRSPSEQEQTLCCGGLSNMTYPQMSEKRRSTLVEEIAKKKADNVVSPCPFCQLALYPHTRQHAFGVENIPALINRAMGGIEYEDKLGNYWGCNSVGDVIEKSREYFVANGYTEEEMSQMLPLLFPFSAG